MACALKNDDTHALVMATKELRSFKTAMPWLCEISDSVAPGKRHFESHLTPAGKVAGLAPTPFHSKRYGRRTVIGGNF